MQTVELTLILLAVCAGMGVLANRLAIPHPVLLVLGGSALAFVPGLPRLQIHPESIFLLFVPPLLYRGALETSLRDFRHTLQPIAYLSVIMVLVTMAVVAVVAHALVPGLSWPAAFVLGAVVSPPDTVAALAVTRRLQVPRVIATVLRGEGLVNDATALVAFRMAVAATVTVGSFSALDAAGSFLLVGAGGIAVGWGMGWAVGRLRLHLQGSPVIENTISLLTPFFAYIPAERLGLSGILAVVAAGLYLGRAGPKIIAPATRLQSEAMWEMIVFVLEGLVFILVGLELPYILASLTGQPFGQLALYAFAISATVILIRIVLLAPGLSVVNLLWRWLGGAPQRMAWRHIAVVSWAGMRGGESMVIALALPLVIAGGAPFPGRDMIIFLTFAVILATLILQGLSLPVLIRLLKLGDDGTDSQEATLARQRMQAAGQAKLQQLSEQGALAPELSARLHERHFFRGRAAPSSVGSDELHAYLAARFAMIAAERAELIALRDGELIGDDVMRALQHNLDLETALLS